MHIVNRTFINSTIVTVLLMALPIALKTISLEPFSSYRIYKWTEQGFIRYQHTQDSRKKGKRYFVIRYQLPITKYALTRQAYQILEMLAQPFDKNNCVHTTINRTEPLQLTKIENQSIRSLQTIDRQSQH